jgi:hypothetical protein
MRKGVATAAHSINVSLQHIRFYGGWAVSSDVVVKAYIDPTVPPSPEAFQLFGWLVPKTTDVQVGVTST